MVERRVCREPNKQAAEKWLDIDIGVLVGLPVPGESNPVSSGRERWLRFTSRIPGDKGTLVTRRTKRSAQQQDKKQAGHEDHSPERNP
jgi:hypothetical protein